MDLRTRTSLFCGALAIAIAASVLLRGRSRRAQIFFALFALDVGLWYLAQWLYHFVQADVWARFTAVLAVLLPQFALHLFEAIFPRPGGRPLLLQVAGVLLVPVVVAVLSPYADHGWVRGTVFLYVFGLFAAGLTSLWIRGERSRSRATQRRVRFLVLIGALAAVFSLADFLWFIGAPLPPVGAVLSIVFLYVLAESLIRDRLIDLYEMLGMAVVSTALAFSLAGIFYIFVELVGGFQTMYLNAILAAIVILTLFEPLRDKVEAYTHFAFRERLDLERAVSRARRELAHVLQVGEMLQVVATALEDSGRATAAAVYLRDPMGADLELGVAFGPKPPPRIEGAAARPLTEHLAESSFVVFEDLRTTARERRRLGQLLGPAGEERLLAASELLGPFRDAVCLGIRSEDGELFGILLLVDNRVSDAFSREDIALLESFAVQIGVVIENSRQYRRMQELDRLAALGQMAAGLAHEVKNPLGAIKGAAQLLGDPAHNAADPATQEFVGIIVEEVDRLDRVVGSVLDYARPSKGNPGALDLNTAVVRTVQVLASSQKPPDVRTELAPDLPPVRADEEQLRQVLMNLIRNAVDATSGDGTVTLSTRRRSGRAEQEYVELAVGDTGPGIPPSVLQNLFVPFFTTKHRGTGLGLAISQRVVQEMGGRIEVASQQGVGSVFTIVLPVAAAPSTLRPVAEDAVPARPADSALEVKPV